MRVILFMIFALPSIAAYAGVCEGVLLKAPKLGSIGSLLQNLSTPDGTLEVIALTAPSEFRQLILRDLEAHPERWEMLAEKDITLAKLYSLTR